MWTHTHTHLFLFIQITILMIGQEKMKQIVVYMSVKMPKENSQFSEEETHFIICIQALHYWMSVSGIGKTVTTKTKKKIPHNKVDNLLREQVIVNTCHAYRK